MSSYFENSAASCNRRTSSSSNGSLNYDFSIEPYANAAGGASASGVEASFASGNYQSLDASNIVGSNSFSTASGAGQQSFSSSIESPSSRSTVNRIAADLLQLSSDRRTLGNSSSNNNEAVSAVEQAILRSTFPIDINETEEIDVNGVRGIYANKSEVANWRGQIPITEYQFNQDPNPEIINKKSTQRLEYIQELAVRYLRPPTPPAPGEIIITQESNKLTPPAPPLVIRQQPPRPSTPEPLVVREAPPQPPPCVGRKVITICGKQLPPPPRKVVIERLPPLPSKPQSVLVERWLPYKESKRRVIFKAAERDPVAVRPRNVVVQWEAPDVSIKKDIKYLGVIRANPAEYVQKYGSSLRNPSDLPSFVLEIKTPSGLVLAADHRYNNVYELEGDVEALRLVDLDREGLSEYRHLVQGNSSSSFKFEAITGSSAQQATASSSSSSGNDVIAEIFSSINLNHNGRITQEEAEKVLLRLNSRLGRSYGEDDLIAFFKTLDVNLDGTIELDEFKRAFESLI